ncbi:MAG: aminopeptidase [Candidatus Nanohaloarchaea archaeon]|nr:aminopeptidase [Candidatus Nanohaloarchaea archaeon]
MSLREGADTVVNQCLNVQPDEHVVVVNDGNDPNLVEALLKALDAATDSHDYMEYEAPERHGQEPPERVAAELQAADVFIAPTQKSITHTAAVHEATEAGARGATLPGITAEIWTTSLLADYDEVARLCREVYDRISGADRVTVTTPSGTDLAFEVTQDYYRKDTGLIHGPGDAGNLPAGETFGAPVNASGTLVVDHLPGTPEGTRIEIEDNRAVAVEHPDGETSGLAEAFAEVDGARNVAEFGVGTNPAATLIGNILQDEKVLGTVHVAFGDNTSMVPEGDGNRVDAEIHQDTVCQEPTVRFDDELLIDAGDPLFT